MVKSSLNQAISKVESNAKTDIINNKDSKGNLKPVSSWAIGQYQHYWKYHSDGIKQSLVDNGVNITNLTDEQIANKYAANPKAQEDYQNKLNDVNLKKAQALKKQYGVNASDEQLQMALHYLGPKTTEDYIKLYKQYGQEKADQIVAYGDKQNHPDIAPIGGPDSARPNKLVSNHLFDFQETFNNIENSNQSKTPVTPVVAKKIPQSEVRKTNLETNTQNFDLVKEVKSKFNVDLTKEQIEILKDPTKTPYNKVVELGLTKVTNPQTTPESGIFDDASQWLDRFLVKKGISDVNETETVKTDVQYKSDVVNSGVNFIGEVKGDRSSYGTFYNKFDRNLGFNYVPVSNVGKSSKDTKYSNVKGIAHFILDSDATDDYKHEYAETYMKKQLKNENIAPGSTVKDQFLPTRIKTKDGKVNVKYKKVSELTKDDYVMAPLRQYNYSDINWEGKTKAEGFANSIAALPTKTGEQTYFIFPNNSTGKSTYGKFGGGSVVFLANNKNFAIDFAGSITDIKNMADKIIKEEKIKPEDLVIAYHDLGSFSAKPKASKTNELSFNQWSGFNNASYTGGGLAFPSN